MGNTIIANEKIQTYFKELKDKTDVLYKVAQKARAKGYDPEDKVDIPLAASVAERSEALIASIMPQISKSGVAERIIELEKQYGAGDWRISLIIGEECAKEKFCKFDDLEQAVGVGIRLGLAYITLAIVAAPLEGLADIKFKKRKDGKNYLSIFYAGPIRAAGGTAAAISVLIADYVRKKCGVADYDITKDEVERYKVEIDDYVTKVAHRQYVPTPEEIELMMASIKIEINGDPTETYDVSK